MNICEWKDGVYKPCEKMAIQIIDDITEKGSFMLSDYTECGCGGNLKPEPEKPFIVKSGGTFVAYDKSVNYLCVKPWDYKNTDMKYIIGLGDEDWKPFTNEKGEHVDKEGKPILELTDEIAKLRSMVTFNGIDLYTLWGYLKEEGTNWLLISDGMNDVEWFDNRSNDLHLATPHELQREEE